MSRRDRVSLEWSAPKDISLKHREKEGKSEEEEEEEAASSVPFDTRKRCSDYVYDSSLR